MIVPEVDVGDDVVEPAPIKYRPLIVTDSEGITPAATLMVSPAFPEEIAEAISRALAGQFHVGLEPVQAAIAIAGSINSPTERLSSVKGSFFIERPRSLF
jgi:hypothetical protein